MYPESPRLRFLRFKDEAKKHAAMMETLTFERASDAAMLQVSLNLPSANSCPETAAANHHRMEGAKLFLGILMTIGDPEIAVPDKPDKGLNYEATKIK